MKRNSNALDVKHVATAHKSRDKPQHALLILRKLVREDKGPGNKRHLTEFLCVLNDGASFRQFFSFSRPPLQSSHWNKKTKHKA